MTKLSDIREPTKVLETAAKGFYVKALTMQQVKDLASKRAELSSDLSNEKNIEELTVLNFSLACDKDGNTFEDLTTYEGITRIPMADLNYYNRLISEALEPGVKAEKKS